MSDCVSNQLTAEVYTAGVSLLATLLSYHILFFVFRGGFLHRNTKRLDLLQMRTATIGTRRKTEKEIPLTCTCKIKRTGRVYMFCCSKDAVLLCYKPKRIKIYCH